MEFEKITIQTGASLLDTLTSALYADPIVVFREYVQNAVDSFSTQKNRDDDLKIEIEIDESAKAISICDNGAGIPPDEFIGRMTSLGNSTKYGKRENIGFRGIGRLAGLSFCDQIYFINKADPARPQFFSLSGSYYREILQSAEEGQTSLQDVLSRISSDCSLSGWENDGNVGFEVIMQGIKDELWSCIHKEKRKNKNEPNSSCHGPSQLFINELSMLLPIPYDDDFASAKIIRSEYKKYFCQDLSQREFNIFLNGEKLVKPFLDIDGTDFLICPIKIFPRDQDETPQVIGLLWLHFYYVFKAIKDNWGLAVRSKNMLVGSGAVVAEEAANDIDAITSYGQYLSALKGVSGELLLDTDLLTDNSRRDWFRIDINSIQLRHQLCSLMNRIHAYRYKISQYVHKENKTPKDKDTVIQAYKDLVSPSEQPSKDYQFENVLQYVLKRERKHPTDERADEGDLVIDAYSSAQKRFYKQIMLNIYEYFNSTNMDIVEYYSLKSFVLKRLNRETEEVDGSGE